MCVRCKYKISKYYNVNYITSILSPDPLSFQMDFVHCGLLSSQILLPIHVFWRGNSQIVLSVLAAIFFDAWGCLFFVFFFIVLSRYFYYVGSDTSKWYCYVNMVQCLLFVMEIRLVINFNFPDYLRVSASNVSMWQSIERPKLLAHYSKLEKR